jgi:hypothetical protein
VPALHYPEAGTGTLLKFAHFSPIPTQQQTFQPKGIDVINKREIQARMHRQWVF